MKEKVYRFILILVLFFIIITIYRTTASTIEIESLSKRISLLEEAVGLQTRENEGDLNLEIIALNAKVSSLSNQINTISEEFIEYMTETERAAELYSKEMDMIEEMMFGDSIFSKDTIKLGDEISNMTVVDIYRHNKELKIYFEGQTIVRGYFEVTPDNDVMFIMNEFAWYLPREFDDRRTRFSFINDNEVKKILEEYDENMLHTIIIKDFVIDLTETETNNSADFVYIISN